MFWLSSCQRAPRLAAEEQTGLRPSLLPTPITLAEGLRARRDPRWYVTRICGVIPIPLDACPGDNPTGRRSSVSDAHDIIAKQRYVVLHVSQQKL